MKRIKENKMIGTGVLLILFACLIFIGANGPVSNEGRSHEEHVEEPINVDSLEARIDSLESNIDVIQASVDTAVYMAGKYGISVELSTMILRTARDVGINTNLAYGLVSVESDFTPTAVSWAGAVGLTQVMPPTARILIPGITREEMFDPETNLRMGFTYLRDMLYRYNGSTRLALLAYNRGPGTVDMVMSRGEDPANGYAKWVMREAA